MMQGLSARRGQKMEIDEYAIMVSARLQTLTEHIPKCKRCHNNKVLCEFHTKEVYRQMNEALESRKEDKYG